MKKVILTGASEGLGYAFGNLCIKNNIKVVALCRTKPDYNCDFIKTDLSDENSITETCKIIKEKHNSFDALINCAGIPGPQKLNEVTYSCLEEVMKINSIAPMFLSAQLIDLIKNNESDVLNVGSTVGLKQGYPDQMVYTTLKYAIRGTSYNLQLELKDTRCRVIQFNVGGMNTRIMSKYTGKEIENPEEWMQPDDVAKLILNIFELPKQMEISEITINRKKK